MVHDWSEEDKLKYAWMQYADIQNQIIYADRKSSGSLILSVTIYTLHSKHTFSAADILSTSVILTFFDSLALSCIIASMIFALLAIFPRVRTLPFALDIGARPGVVAWPSVSVYDSSETYARHWKSLQGSRYLGDLLNQVYLLACLVRSKNGKVQMSFACLATAGSIFVLLAVISPPSN